MVMYQCANSISTSINRVINTKTHFSHVHYIKNKNWGKQTSVRENFRMCQNVQIKALKNIIWPIFLGYWCAGTNRVLGQG